jgi:hypothetical protein
MMKPEHLPWVNEISRRLDATTTAVLDANRDVNPR